MYHIFSGIPMVTFFLVDGSMDSGLDLVKERNPAGKDHFTSVAGSKTRRTDTGFMKTRLGKHHH